ncbi:DNA polymerase III, delta subunit [Anoxybacillus sp. B7M1]|uniref:DNA polymerase III subunit delta n=1 Tax=unclassified Anoxybacillus TaxID=2639704 RepID=UPI0005CD567D|nr:MULTISPECIES: DNA polymerase III subunit delta [unclassified Anoxybacillus]ANB55912.1 DNA polymerase III, delta subunit [Anoxybacillus sp. B2M1]ANB63698.1 DNA polymerase III, delta subunit [Anoxybacillus sp. B7M1]
MTVNFLGKMIKQTLSPLYLLYGTETFLLNEAYERIVRTALREEEQDFHLSVYDCEETPIETAIEEAETLPFFGEKKVVVIKNPYFLTSDKGKEKIEHNLKKLEQYIASPSPFTIVVFLGSYEKLDERKKITKQLMNEAKVFVASSLNEKELRQWMEERAHANEVAITEEAKKTLLQLAGTNLMSLANELDKLSLFVGHQGTIDGETVTMLVSRTLEQNVFVLVEKVVQRKVREALQVFGDLMEHNEEPIKIVALLAAQFRLLYQVKWLNAKGYGQQHIASSLKVHPFRVKLAMAQSGLFSEQELLDIIHDLAEADYQMKTGVLDKRLLIELLLVKWSKANETNEQSFVR